LSWINRYAALTGRAPGAFLAALICFTALLAVPASAGAPMTAVYGSHRIRFTHLAALAGGMAIGVEDPGFQDLLRDTGSVLTWKPGRRYVLITTGVPVVVSFAVGDRSYEVGPITLQASFAPYWQGDEVYLPLNEVLGALGLALKPDGAVAVLQPQLSSLDVRSQGDRVTIAAHTAAAVPARIVEQSPDGITYAFEGVGTTLAGTRRVDAGGVSSVTIAQSGTIRDPSTLVTVHFEPGTVAESPRSDGSGDVTLAFSGRGSGAPAASAPESNGPPASAAPAPSGAVAAAPSPSAGPALVTGVSVQPSDGGETVTIAVSGNAAFEWHRLLPPDNRFWVDIKDAQLNGPPIEENEPDPLVSVRVRQDDPTTVRVALSLTGPKALEITPSATGLTIGIGTQDVADAPRSGGGSVGTIVSAGEQTALVTPAPTDESANAFGDSSDSYWKFGPRSAYVPSNPHLIVIDPGHGGSDTGAIRNGVEEKTLTLDMAKRLRDILEARGWQVMMTRDADVDVYAPDDTAHQELQARVNVANQNGARLFVSIHVNSFINSGPYGTTCYISKPSDWPLARAMERQLDNDGTKDDGIVKSHLYVTLHTLMPAVLIETAFLSNPNDFALLTDPAWRQKVAQEMADGIQQYTQANPVPDQGGQ
jgi:N-acetylmuramoyl-L-alanine amidase